MVFRLAINCNIGLIDYAVLVVVFPGGSGDPDCPGLDWQSDGQSLYDLLPRYVCIVLSSTMEFAGIYSPSHIVQITDVCEFLHECCKEKSETFSEFYTNLVLTRNIKIIS